MNPSCRNAADSVVEAVAGAARSTRCVASAFAAIPEAKALFNVNDDLKDKITVFWAREDFDDSTNIGFLPLAGGGYLTRMPDGSVREHRDGQGELPEAMSQVLAAIERDYPFILAEPEGARP